MLESCPSGASLTSKDDFATTPVYSTESSFPTAVVSVPAPPAKFEKPLLPQLQPVALATPRIGMKRNGIFASSSETDTISPGVSDNTPWVPSALRGYVTNFQFLLLAVLFAVVVIMFQYKISKMNQHIHYIEQTLFMFHHQNRHPYASRHYHASHGDPYHRSASSFLP